MNGMKRFFRGCCLLVLIGLVFVRVQHVRAQKASSASSPKVQYRVGILPFVDNTDSGGEDLGPALGRAVQAEMTHSTDLMARALKLDEGATAEDLDAEKAVAIGRARKVDVVLLGTVLEASSEESEQRASTPLLLGQEVGGSARSVKAMVTLQGDLFNVADGKKVDSIRVTGRASDTKVGANVSSSLGDISSEGSSFDSSPIGKAFHSAVAELVKKIDRDQSSMVRSGLEPVTPPSSEAATPPPPASQPKSSEVASEPAASEHPASPCQIVFRVILTDSMTPIRDYTISVQGRDLTPELKDGILRLKNPDPQLQLQVRLKNPPPGINVQPEYTGRIESKCDKPQKVVVLEIGSDGSGRFNSH